MGSFDGSQVRNRGPVVAPVLFAVSDVSEDSCTSYDR